MSKNAKGEDEKIYETFSITMELERPLFKDEEYDIDISERKEKKEKKRKNTFRCLIILVLACTVGFLLWSNKTYKPKKLAKQALISSETVEVKDFGDISFIPKKVNATKGFIFYPGAKVEPEAYAPICRDIAENGYQVIVAKMPLNLAVFSPNKGEEIMKEYPNIESWVVGGHSLGGVMAADFASKNNLVDGVVFLASYSNGGELKNLGKDVLSVWGSKDGILNFDKISISKEKLPDYTKYVEIEGGNHSQFGDYGTQSGDSDAIISQEEQMEITSSSIVEFLKSIN
ncbi:MAG: alpha/beta hydrolase [Romboutsia sp.]